MGDSRLAGAAALVLAAAIAAGCAATETRSYRLDPATAPLATWNGKNVDQVLEVWGTPSEREGDGEGGSILVYRENTAVSTSVSEGAKTPSPSPTPETPAGSATQTRLTRVRARFWIDAGGTVYRYWFSNDVYKHGEGELPSPKKPDEGKSQEP